MHPRHSKQRCEEPPRRANAPHRTPLESTPASRCPCPGRFCSSRLAREVAWRAAVCAMGTEGRKLRSDEYITLRKLKPCDPATASTRRKRAEKRFQKHVALWDASAAIVEALCPDFEWTTLAITRNFRGSPHRDRLDTRHQLAISLGDFKDGEGLLCVESADGRVVTKINTKNSSDA